MSLFGGINKFLALAIGVVLGVMVYAMMLWLLKVPEFGSIIWRVKGKLAQKG